MEWLNSIAEWISAREHRVPIGEWSKAAVEWLTTNFESAFDLLTTFLDAIIQGTVDVFLAIPALVFILLASGAVGSSPSSSSSACCSP